MNPNFDAGFSRFYAVPAAPVAPSGLSGKNMLIIIVAGIATAIISYRLGMHLGMTKMYKQILAQNKGLATNLSQV